ncbi:hypothetical protein, partial [Burkholderia multivorans]|uniref:hypothetical protein n=1 Tax=Burkholderia multivorans TaxID=87883 RepID=UPI001C65C96B
MPLQPPRVGDESTADLTGIIRARRREVWAKRLTVLGSIAAVLALAAVAWFSPLLALMRDQIAAAERAGVRAATLNSSNVTEWDDVLDELRAGSLDVLLISPERLNNP